MTAALGGALGANEGGTFKRTSVVDTAVPSGTFVTNTALGHATNEVGDLTVASDCVALVEAPSPPTPTAPCPIRRTRRRIPQHLLRGSRASRRALSRS